MGRRLITLVASLAIGTIGALVFVASPSSASTTLCNFPNPPEVTSLSKAAAEDKVEEVVPQFGKCLEVVWTDQCDGNTFVSMTNWVKNDNDWTVLHLELLGKTYTLEGGSSPNTEEALLGPKVKDAQAYLVFTLDNGTIIKVPYGKPWTWEEPKGCVSPSPSASASPVPSSPAPTITRSTLPPPTVGSNDLPVTGASTIILIAAAIGLVGGATLLFLRRRRNNENVA